MSGTIRKPAGFTLVEVMVVVAIVAIVATIALPSYQSVMARSRRGDAIISLMMLQQAQEHWRANHPLYGELAEVWPGGQSVDAYYELAVSDVTAAGFRASAQPGADGPQANDRCGRFVINQDGPVYGEGLADPGCWQR